MANVKYANAWQRKKAVSKQNYAYKKRSMTQISIRFHNENDADIIAKLKSLTGIGLADYVRKLVRDDIAKGE